MIGHVLVIEPLTTNRIVMKASLACAHYEVRCVKSWEDASRSLKDQTPSFVFIDASFERKVIKKLRRALQNRSERVDIPIVVLANSTNAISLEDIRNMGAQDLMVRPIKANLMLARMRSLTSRAQSINALRKKTHYIGATASDQSQKSDNLGCSQIVVIARSLYRAQMWAEKLQMSENIAKIEAFDYAEILHRQHAPERNTINLLIDDPVSEPDDILHILSSLRARDDDRKSYYLTAFLEGAHHQAAMALDMGADDIAWVDEDVAQVASRLRTLSILQKEIDALNAQLDDGLRMAVIDPLTGLFNRRYSDQKLAQLADDARQHGEILTVMLLDIDHFKKVNDLYGHGVGDHVLTHVAATLKNELRDCDLLARIGGEEFLLALPETAEVDAIAAADRIRIALESLFFPTSLAKGETKKFQITASIGVAVSGDQDCPLSITQRADQALYQAKSAGRNCARLECPRKAA